jgi:hypothetical protein
VLFDSFGVKKELNFDYCLLEMVLDYIDLRQRVAEELYWYFRSQYLRCWEFVSYFKVSAELD